MSTLKHKGKGPQSLTANELREGYSVWLTEDMTWSRDFKDALLTEDEGVMEQMQAKGEEDEGANLVVGVYFIDVEPDTGLPARYREKFRMRGPSIDTADLVER
ncbi:DUF2849 domain-containing protein [Litorimonas sp. RW-G-Af-16]|uniref:DUF2849 domain-containing protein n=1 Tax=Litorimonas sp. RW-G-Af-16 TaxID=3241168 RepID=UPI00390C7790